MTIVASSLRLKGAELDKLASRVRLARYGTDESIQSPGRSRPG